MKFFTADMHFGHGGIIKACKRPFYNSNHMDKELIKNYNNVVTDNDDVYVIGDLSIRGPEYKQYLMRIINSLNGKKHLILGNHDKLNPSMYKELGFLSVHTWLEIKIDTIGFVTLVHDPCYSLISPEHLFLCSRHDLFKYLCNIINVGVDMWNYTPISEKTIMDAIACNKLTF
jgi:calcineurin-like phosphoesterase family protein